MVGPPGSGKTLLARTIPGLLPPLDEAEALGVTMWIDWWLGRVLALGAAGCLVVAATRDAVMGAMGL